MSTKRVFKNLKNITTAKIVEILSTPYCTTDKGTDYGPVADELKGLLWERQGREADEKAKQLEKEMALYSLMQVQSCIQDPDLPPIPSECDEGWSGQNDYTNEPPLFLYLPLTGTVLTLKTSNAVPF
jgi:hypothetical protein